MHEALTALFAPPSRAPSTFFAVSILKQMKRVCSVSRLIPQDKYPMLWDNVKLIRKFTRTHLVRGFENGSLITILD
jgi:hypothetical protein